MNTYGLRPQNLSGQLLVSIVLAVLFSAAGFAQSIRNVPGTYSTIQGAINASANGDTVRVAPGTYVENINFNGKAITVVSAVGPESTIIDGNQAGTVVQFASHEGASSVLQGFTIRNGYVSANGGGGITINDASPTILSNLIVNNRACSGSGINILTGSPLIQRNTISGNNTSGCSGNGGGGIYIQGTPQVLDNIISDNTATNSAGGIYVADGTSPLIRGNVITGNRSGSGGGIRIDAGATGSNANIIQNVIASNSAGSGGGIYLRMTFNSGLAAFITNNTVVDNHADSAGSAMYSDGYDEFATIRNNIFVPKTGQTTITCGSLLNSIPPVLAFNIIVADQAAAFGGICTDVTGSNGNISTAPLFANRVTGDFHLLSGSAGINAGDNSAANLPSLDFDGGPRILPLGGTVDLGAFEFAEPTTLTLSYSTLTFEDQSSGTVSAPMDVTVTNTGAQILAVRNVAIIGEFSQSNTCQLASGIAPGQTCTISIRFQPVTSGARSGQLTVTSSGAGSNVVTLSGNGVGSPLTLSTSLLSFGDQRLGTTAPTMTVTVSNTGNSNLNISNFTTIGADFPSSNDCPSSLNSGSSCTVSVQFTPSSRGTKSGVVTVTSGATGSPHYVLLSGRGVAPSVSFNVASLQFGSLAVGGTSTPQSVVVANNGDLPLAISSISVTGDYSGTNDCPSSLAVGSTCTIAVVFSPTAALFRGGAVTVVDDAIGSPHTVTLSGTGIGLFITTTPSSLDFGSQAVNTTSTVKTVTVRNTGTGNISISSTAISSDYSRTNTCGLLTPNATCNISVSFKPTTVGSRPGTLTITDTAAGSPHVVTLAGVGTDVVLSPSPLVFGDIHVGTTANRTVTFANISAASLNISSISVSAGFSQTNTCGTTLTSGSSCTINVQFTPASSGSFITGTLTVVDDGVGSPQTVALSGRGVIGTVGLSTSTLTFATDVVGTLSPTQVVTVSNSGIGPLTFSNISTSGDFTKSSGCGTTLAAGANCTINVAFGPVAAGNRTGALIIASDGTANLNTVTLSGTGLATLPVPVITGLSPDNKSVGSAGTNVTVNGSGFSTLSVVRWWGADRPTNFVNSTTLTVTISSSDLAALGSIPVSVFNPAPGGGTSNNESFIIYQSITLSTKDLVADRPNNKIYASVPFSAPALANSLTAIDPVTGALGGSVPIGLNPDKLAISGDSHFIYVALDGAGEVRTFDTVQQLERPKIVLGSDPQFGAYFAEDIAVAPGQSETIAVSRMIPSLSPRHAGIAVYDSGVKRPVETPGHDGNNVIGFSDLPSILYGSNIETTEAGFRTNTLSSAGVTITDTKTNFPVGRFQFSGGRIYSIGGKIIDPVNKVVLGSFALPSFARAGGVAVDSAFGRVFLLTGGSTDAQIQAFDLNSLALTGSVSLPGLAFNTSVGSLIRWGETGLAFQNGTQIITFQIPLSWLGNPVPALTLSPNSAKQGAANVSIAVTGQFTNFVQGQTTANFGTGITVNSINVVDAQHVAVNITIASGAAPGLRNVTMTTSGQSPAPVGQFNVNPIEIPVKPTKDFAGTGRSGVLWRDTAGNVSMWQLNGSTVSSDATIANIWSGWSIAGTGDFNGDGKADILWRDPGGNVAIWLMNGTSVASYAAVANMDNSWTIAAVADFNGDNQADILWRNVSGDVAIWQMNGTMIAANTVIGNIWPGWMIVGAADFNSDGKADILWRSVSGEVAMWQMNGFSVVSSTNIASVWTGWTIAGIADFDGDGRTDILWRDVSGNIAIWLMNGSTVIGWGLVSSMPNGWSIATTGDFNADGKADILWRDSSGNTAIWQMNGQSVSSSTAAGNVSDRMAQ